jgi:HEPN domain-containing protein
MQPDDLRLRDTQEWLARSAEDLRNAEHDLIAKPPFVRDALFHAQQAVEKACKGLLTWCDQPFAKIHNLEETRKPVCHGGSGARHARTARRTPE